MPDRQRRIGHHLVGINADHTSESAAFRAGTHRVVEREQRGRRRTQRESGARIRPRRRERACGGFTAHRGKAFAEPQCRLERLAQARAIGAGDPHAVLHHIDRARQPQGDGGGSSVRTISPSSRTRRYPCWCRNEKNSSVLVPDGTGTGNVISTASSRSAVIAQPAADSAESGRITSPV